MGTSEELDTEEQVEALEQVDRVLSRADRLSGATFFGRFLVKEYCLVKRSSEVNANLEFKFESMQRIFR